MQHITINEFLLYQPTHSFVTPTSVSSLDSPSPEYVNDVLERS